MDDVINLEDQEDITVSEQEDTLVIKFDKSVTFEAGNVIKIDLSDVKQEERDRVGKIWKESISEVLKKKLQIKKEVFFSVEEYE